MRNCKYLIILFVLLQGCTDKSILFYKTTTIKESKWVWSDAKTYTYSHSDTSRKVDFNVALRINNNYLYSNIWIKYRITGEGLNETNQFSIQLADNEYGKWLGQSSGSVLSYEQAFIKNKALKPGMYTITYWQNMRDSEIESVLDIGLKVTKGEPNF